MVVVARLFPSIKAPKYFGSIVGNCQAHVYCIVKRVQVSTTRLLTVTNTVLTNTIV